MGVRRVTRLTDPHSKKWETTTRRWMVKSKFRDNVRSKTDVAMKNEVLTKFLCHNLCVLIQSQCELGIEPVFWPNDDKVPQDVLPLVRRG